MSSKRPLHVDFEKTISGIVPDILGDDCPDAETLRKPGWKGGRFRGLLHDQRERLKAPGIAVPSLFKVGLHLLARFHVAKELRDFDGDFTAYVRARLFEVYGAFKDVPTVAAIYGVPLIKVEALARIYSASYRIEGRGFLQRDLSRAIRLDKTDKLISHFKMIQEAGDVYRPF